MIELVRRAPGGQIALIEPARGRTVTYGELRERWEAAGGALRATLGTRALAFLVMGNDTEAVTLYLGCLSSDMPVCLIEPAPNPLQRLVEAYGPALLILPASMDAPSGFLRHAEVAEGYGLWIRNPDRALAVHPDLSVLLSTSGSTGNPKLVRLSARNLSSNAESIARYLELGSEERAITSLPLHYSYGLSVLNSHLVAGGAAVLTDLSFLRPEFWAVAAEERCTSFAGVPFMYETLHRLRFDPKRYPALRTLTQAGGALRRELIEHYGALARATSGRFFVMYGQTEATARISYVPPETLPRKAGSIGIPIPGGRMSLVPAETAVDADELLYEGPNVMLGYADSPADLARGDVQRGVLRTGDLAREDADGFFYITGRLKRFAKLFGKRVSLEDIEVQVESGFPVLAAAVDAGDRIVLHVESRDPPALRGIAAATAERLGVPPSSIEVVLVGALPRTASGKKDYRALEASQ